MKKLISIFFLMVFLFNIIGYKAIFYLMEHKAATQLEADLDVMKLSGLETITIKIPLKLPYETNWADYERVDGEVNYNGKDYKYFKQKIYNDSLILVCVNFKEKNQLKQKSDDYFKKINDLKGQSGKKQTLKQEKFNHEIPYNKDVLVLTVKKNIEYQRKSNYPPGWLNRAFMPPDSSNYYI